MVWSSQPPTPLPDVFYSFCPFSRRNPTSQTFLWLLQPIWATGRLICKIGASCLKITLAQSLIITFKTRKSTYANFSVVHHFQDSVSSPKTRVLGSSKARDIFYFIYQTFFVWPISSRSIGRSEYSHATDLMRLEDYYETSSPSQHAMGLLLVIVQFNSMLTVLMRLEDFKHRVSLY